MKALFTRIALTTGCLIVALSAQAYTTSDCTNVEQLAAKGVVGYKNTCNEYNLDRTISRQEVAAVTLKVGEICGSIQNIPPAGQYVCDNLFSDVSTNYPNDWVCRVAETLAQEGVISQNDRNQYGDIFFRPLKNITRAEALAMLMNGADLRFQDTIYDDWRFNGTGAVTWQKPLIQYAYDRGVISSISSFSPNTYAYRRDVFNYANRVIDLCKGGTTGTTNPNNCALGQYYSSGMCLGCTSKPSYGYYTTPGSCIWECTSGYYKSGNTCVANSNNYGTVGQCGYTANLCTVGYLSNTIYSGGYTYWSCTGTNNVAVSCSAYGTNTNYGTTGQCGTSINSCLSGTFYDTTDYGNYAYWNCTGSNGTAVSCSAYNNNYYGTTGQCGTSINSCLSGTFYDTTDYGNYAYWNCTGSNGTAVSCSAYNNNYYGTTGQCGTSINSCLSGTFYDTTDYGNYAYWNCTGSNGTAVSCSAYNNNYYGTTGQCGTSINSCLSGTFYDTTDYGNYAYWNCTGSNGTAVSCSAYNNNYYGTTGQCGTSINSCLSGTFYDTTDYGNYAYWNCTGSNGTAVSCSAYNNNYYGTTGQCGTSINSCLSGTFYDTTDYGNYAYWNCTGSNGTAVSCSAYNNTNNNSTNCSIAAPSNSYYTNSQNCWSCNPGYVQINNMCVWWN